MAYITAAQSKAMRAKLKAELPGWKFSVSIHYHSSLNVTVLAGPIDVFADWIKPQKVYPEDVDYAQNEIDSGRAGVNHYYLDKSWKGETLAMLEKVKAICNEGNFDRSDIQSDYFHVGWYFHLQIGGWNKPYVNTSAAGLKAAA